MMQTTSLAAGDLYIQAEKYVGIPYAEHGRDTFGVDCYGLFRLFYLQEFDILLPDFQYTEYTTATHARIIQQNMLSVVHQIAESDAVPGDAVLLAYGGSISHIALYLGHDAILHASRSMNAKISRLTDMEGIRTLRSRIAGWYRCHCT